MSAQDISRLLLSPSKHYSSVRFQQGRVFTDADFNEATALLEEESRQANLHIIGRYGSPDDGFRVGTPAVKTVSLIGDEGTIDRTTYTFSIGRGSYYVGGIRFSHNGGVDLSPGALPSEVNWGGEFLEQEDWLMLDALPNEVPTAPGPGFAGLGVVLRRDFAYLVGWEQTVSAVEDSELFEHALGGPDTTLRTRRFAQVRVVPGVKGATCGQIFPSQVVGRFDALGGNYTYDSATSRLKSQGRCFARFGEVGSVHPCAPEAVGGYLGAENHTIQVRLFASNRFVWGFDNGSPLYRVVPYEGEPRKLRFLTPPRDQDAQPLAGQAIELMPWGALLDNLEKSADYDNSKLIGVQGSYNPDDQTISLAQDIPDEWLRWFAAHANLESPRDDVDVSSYFYARVWTGTSGNVNSPAIPTVDGVPENGVALAGTGIRLFFTQEGNAGDFWVFSARPNSPDSLVPWAIAPIVAPSVPVSAVIAEPPSGPNRYIAPVAIIEWSVQEVGDHLGAAGRAIDCRPRFRPLTESSGCCTIEVAPGQSIQDAIEMLPPEGGKICLGAGVYDGSFSLHKRGSVEIVGCGTDTVIKAGADDANLAIPLVLICSSQRITLRNLALEPNGRIGVQIQGTTSQASGHTKDVRLENLQIHSLGDEVEDLLNAGTQKVVRAAVVCFHAEGLLIEKCSFSSSVHLNLEPMLILRGSGMKILNNRLEAARAQPLRVYSESRGTISREGRPLGGIHILSTSENVEIGGNLISGGRGHGIALGHLKQEFGGAAFAMAPASIDLSGSTDGIFPLGLLYIPSFPGYVGYDSEGYVLNPYYSVAHRSGYNWMSDGPLRSFRIHSNDIRDCGISGISVANFTGEKNDGISCVDFIVENNRISSVAWAKWAYVSEWSAQASSLGGIALARFSDSEIRANRIGPFDARQSGVGYEFSHVCGIFVLQSENVAASNNSIVAVGREGLHFESESFNAAIAIGYAKQRLTIRDNHVQDGGGRALSIHDGDKALIEVHGNFLDCQDIGWQRARAELDLNVHLRFGSYSVVAQEKAIPRAILVSAGYDGSIVFSNNRVACPNVGVGLTNQSFSVFLSAATYVAVLNNHFSGTLVAENSALKAYVLMESHSVNASNNYFHGSVTTSGRTDAARFSLLSVPWWRSGGTPKTETEITSSELVGVIMQGNNTPDVIYAAAPERDWELATAIDRSVLTDGNVDRALIHYWQSIYDVKPVSAVYRTENDTDTVWVIEMYRPEPAT
jgi:hypothetical protein